MEDAMARKEKVRGRLFSAEALGGRGLAQEDVQ
jgi:hypothetical protein